MNTATINIKTTTETKTKAQKIAESLGMNLSTVIDQYLKTFIKTQGEDLQEEPNDYMIQALKESEADVKVGRVSPHFTNAKDAIAWLDDPNATYANGDKVRDEV